MIILEAKQFPYIQGVLKRKLTCMISNGTGVNQTSTHNITENALQDVPIVGELFRSSIYNSGVYVMFRVNIQ